MAPILLQFASQVLLAAGPSTTQPLDCLDWPKDESEQDRGVFLQLPDNDLNMIWHDGFHRHSASLGRS